MRSAGVEPDRGSSRGSARRHALGGVDEAGYGPLLGPLVVAGVVLEGPAGASPWDLLDRVFCKKPSSRRDRRVRVDDSKRVKTGAKGYAQVERTALTLLHAAVGRLPANLAELFALAIAHDDLARYPWYAGLEDVPLPRRNARAELELEVHVAARRVAEAGVRCNAAVFHPVLVGSFNELCARHRNKSLALFDATLPILRACLDAATEPLTVVADRHGGRSRYLGLLRRGLAGRRVETLEEGAFQSRYRVGDAELDFVASGDSLAFPTAGASCLAKYVRELCVEQINRWFAARRPGLRPTAGYYEDGRRFLEDVAGLRRDLRAETLVRSR